MKQDKSGSTPLIFEAAVSDGAAYFRKGKDCAYLTLQVPQQFGALIAANLERLEVGTFIVRIDGLAP